MRLQRVVLMMFISSWLWWSTAVVIAQQDDSVLIPALQIFNGPQSTQQIYYLVAAAIGIGLLIALLFSGGLLATKKFSIQSLIKILGVWLVFSAGISAIALSVYVSEDQRTAILRADGDALPRQVVISVNSDSIVARWRTQKVTIGQLVFTSNVREDPVILLSNGADPTSFHEVRISIRPGEQEFWLSVISDGLEYRLDDEPIYLKI